MPVTVSQKSPFSVVKKDLLSFHKAEAFSAEKIGNLDTFEGCKEPQGASVRM